MPPESKAACATAQRSLDSLFGVDGPLGENVLAPNLVILSGTVVREPREETSPSGAPVTLLIVEFPAPDAEDSRERRRSARNSIEVPRELLASYEGKIEKGTPLLILGKLAGGGDVLATSLQPATLRPVGEVSGPGGNQ